MFARWTLHTAVSLTTLVWCKQGRKTAAQVQRLEALHAKQQAVLRRKTEEAEAARKRLHVSNPSQPPMKTHLLFPTSHPLAEFHA